LTKEKARLSCSNLLVALHLKQQQTEYWRVAYQD